MLSKNPSEYRYFVELAYNGSKYHGWQIQPNAITVQEVLNKALSTLLNCEVNLVGAGRTDTGVHASHFVAHFNLEKELQDAANLVYKLNRYLSSDIRIDRILLVDNELHARFSAVARTYHYVISRNKSPFLDEFAWTYTRDLDLGQLKEASKVLMEYSDFTSFARLHADTKTTICELREAEWTVQNDYWIFKVTADRFLRNMVRAIVGTLMEVGSGKLSIKEFKAIIEGKDRSLAGQSAPPQGLFLSNIEYPQDLFKSQPKGAFFDTI